MRTLFLSVLVSSAFSSAEVIPFLFDMNNNNDFTVPAGKVVLIEQIQSTQNPVGVQIDVDNTGSGISTETGNMDVNLDNPGSGATPKLAMLDKPLRLRAGWNFENRSGESFIIAGLIIDEADLYAAGVPNEWEMFAAGNAMLSGQVRVQSARPVTQTVQSSTDFNSWVTDPTVTVQNTSDRTLLQIDGSATDDFKFYRVETRTRD